MLQLRDALRDLETMNAVARDAFVLDLWQK